MAKLTINDIAKAAGVSKATVSRVINQRPDVSEKMRNHVLALIAKYDYHPDAIAQSVGNGMSRTIALGIPSGIGNTIKNTYYSNLIGAILDELYRNNFYLLFAHHSLEAYEDLINSSRVDGFIIMTSARQREEIIRLMEQKKLPCVLTSAMLDQPFPYADIDNIDGGKLATRYLLRHGHRHIAYIYADGYSSYLARCRGYDAAMKESGVILPECYKMRIEAATFRGGYDMACKILDRMQDRPTAVFACNDFVAQGVMAACVERGLSLPRDMSVIGFDNNELGEHLSPMLTSVDQCVERRGKLVAQMIIEYVTTGKAPTPVMLEASIVERASVCDYTEKI